MVVVNNNVATLALGSRPRQRGCKVAGQEGSSGVMLPGVQENVREWTLTLPRELSHWELESRWIPRCLESNYRGQNPWKGTKYTIRGKVVASPKSGPW